MREVLERALDLDYLRSSGSLEEEEELDVGVDKMFVMRWKHWRYLLKLLVEPAIVTQ